jgi:hypothetical protein
MHYSKMVNDIPKSVVYQFSSQRGTGKPVKPEEAIAYDFMPVLLGDQFRTEPGLSGMLLRPAPETGPFILQIDAYETLGKRYARQGALVQALECYRIATDTRTGLARAVADHQGLALPNEREMRRVGIASGLEKQLLEQVARSGRDHVPGAFAAWVEELRAARKIWQELNGIEYNSREHAEAGLRIGQYEEAFTIAVRLRDYNLAERIGRVRPREILDVEFLRRFIEDSHPSRSTGRPDTAF